MSAATAWEAARSTGARSTGSGGRRGVEPLVAAPTACREGGGFEPLPHPQGGRPPVGGVCPNPSRDPFDRRLTAQALERDLAAVTIEEAFAT